MGSLYIYEVSTDLALFFSRMAARRDDVFPAVGVVVEGPAPVFVSDGVLAVVIAGTAVAPALLSSLTCHDTVRGKEKERVSSIRRANT